MNNPETGESEALFRKFFDSSVLICGIVEVDNGNLAHVAANQACASMFGSDTESLCRKTAREANLPPEWMETWLARCEDARRASAPVRFEYAHERPEGTRFLLVTITALEVPENGRYRFAYCATDVTEQKRLENHFLKIQKMESIGALAGGIAHDFNNVLTIINTCCDLLISELGPSDSMLENLSQIRDATLRGESLCSQLLAFGRRQVLQPKVLSLNEIVRRAAGLLRRVVGDEIRFRVVSQPDLWMVRADPGQLDQVVMNLVLNARDAMPQGGELTLETANAEFDDSYAANHPGAAPGRYAMLAVSDTGTGIDPEIRARVFEPFFSTKGPGKGTGLGLSTVYGIIKQSGGFIGLHSEPGLGTTFEIFLPRAEGVPQPVQPERPEQRDGEFMGGVEKILIVEDDGNLRNVVARALRLQGFTVHEASNGQEALWMAKAMRDPIHLVLTDISMPSMSGVEFAEKLAKVRPQTRVVFASGYLEGSFPNEFSLPPNFRILQKPFSISALTRKIREILDRPSSEGQDGEVREMY
jgi:two-component system, cell cycle sensor histidine kinase and response regulator CckA